MAGSRFKLEAVFRAIDRFTGPMARMESRAMRMTRGLRAGLGRVNAFTDATIAGLRRVAVVAGVAGVAVGAVAKNVIGTGMDFEQAITNVAAVAGKTRGEIGALEERALRLGKTTKFTGAEVAAGMELMARAGFKNQEILQGIEGVLSAAAASGLDMAEVASHVSNVLKGMGLEASEAGRVADVLTKASQSTNSTIGSLGESMKNVAPVARQLGVSFEEAVAAVALLQDVGMDASQAGTATATMLTKLTKPTGAVASKLRKMGVTFQNAKGNMLTFGEVLANMATMAEKSGGNMEQVAMFADLVGLRGQKAALNLQDLAKKGKLTDLVSGLRQAKGTAQQVADTKMDTLKGDITLLQSAVDGLKVKLFKTEGGPLRGVVQGMTDWVGKNEDLIVQKVSEWVEKFKDNLPEIVKWTKRIATGIATLYAFSIAVKITSVAVTLFQGVLSVCSGAVRLFTAAVRLARTAVLSERAATLAAAASTGVHTAAVKLRTAAIWLGQVATTQITWATIAATAATVRDTVAAKANAAAQATKNAALKIGRGLVAAYTALTSKSTAANVANTVSEKAKAIAQGLSAAAAKAAAGVAGVYAVATGKATAATWGFNASLTATLVTVGALTAALGALYAAWDQYKKLKDEVGGNIWAVAEKVALGQGLYQAVDNTMNEQARARAAERVPEPQGGGEAPGTGFGIRAEPQKVEAEITIRDESGRAEVTKPPKTGAGRVSVQPSGAF